MHLVRDATRVELHACKPVIHRASIAELLQYEELVARWQAASFASGHFEAVAEVHIQHARIHSVRCNEVWMHELQRERCFSQPGVLLNAGAARVEHHCFDCHRDVLPGASVHDPKCAAPNFAFDDDRGELISSMQDLAQLLLEVVVFAAAGGFAAGKILSAPRLTRTRGRGSRGGGRCGSRGGAAACSRTHVRCFRCVARMGGCEEGIVLLEYRPPPLLSGVMVVVERGCGADAVVSASDGQAGDKTELPTGAPAVLSAVRWPAGQAAGTWLLGRVREHSLETPGLPRVQAGRTTPFFGVTGEHERCVGMTCAAAHLGLADLLTDSPPCI
jgi:hypothetical protein